MSYLIYSQFMRALDPLPDITNPEARQRSRLLSALILVLTILWITSLIIAVIVDPGDLHPALEYTIGLVAIWGAMFAINKRGKTNLAVMGVILSISIVILYVTFPMKGPPIFLSILILPILFASIFFSERNTIAFTIVLLLVVFLLMLQVYSSEENAPFWTLQVVWFILLLVTGLILTSNRHTILLEEIRNETLQSLNTSLQISEARIRALLEYSPDTILEIDRRGNIIFVSRLVDDYLGKNVREVIPADQVDFAFETIEKAFQSGKPQSVELQVLAPSGDVSWDMVRLGPIKTDEAVTSLTVIVTDLTEKKLAEEAIKKQEERYRRELEFRIQQRTAQLEASNKELESFSYMVSHDLRGPLRGISGYTTLLQKDYQDAIGEEGRFYLGNISQAAEKMNQLIEDLLQLARISHHDFTRTRVSLSQLAARFFEMKREGEPERQVEITIQPDMLVEGDANLLVVVVENLLGNAWKFTHNADPARIVFKTRQGEGDATQFMIQDNGIGFDMAYRQKVFEPFERLVNAEDFEGTGIGLATVKRIIELHGGRVWAESGGVGTGATFIFTLQDGAAGQG